MYIIRFSRNVTILCIITYILKCYWCCFVLMYCYLLVALVLAIKLLSLPNNVWRLIVFALFLINIILLSFFGT